MRPLIDYVVTIVLFSTTPLGAPKSDTFTFGEDVLPPFGHTVFCQTYPAECESSRSARLFPNTATRRAELDTINRQANASIAPETEEVGNIDKNWRLAPAKGNCSDYAVTKRHDLLQKGWSSSSLLLAEVTLKIGEHHLILVVRTAAGEFVLDNLDQNVLSLAEARKRYAWNRIESPIDPKRWNRPNIEPKK